MILPSTPNILKLSSQNRFGHDLTPSPLERAGVRPQCDIYNFLALFFIMLLNWVKVYSLQNKKKHLLFVLCFLLAASSLFAQRPGNAIDSIVGAYNQRALDLLNMARYEESSKLANLALKTQENPVSYTLLAHINNQQNNFEEAARLGEIAKKLNPNFMPAYSELFGAYFGLKKWREAQDIIDWASSKNANGFAPDQVIAIGSALQAENISKVLMILFLALLAGIFFLPIWLGSKNKKDYFAEDSTGKPRMAEAFLLGATFSAIYYLLFFAFSKAIWSTNPVIPASDFAPNIRTSIYEHDGLESFILYVMMLLVVAQTIFILPIVSRLRSNKNLYMGINLAMLGMTGYYFNKIGFFPPIPSMDVKNIFLPVILVTATYGIYLGYLKSPLIGKVGLIILAAFAGLISWAPTSTVDLMYVVEPGLRLIHGFKIPEIYFQYDLYMSFLAAFWLKMNYALVWFPYLGQVSFFLLFIAAFLFADKFFQTKGLSAIFMVALILMRVYCLGYDNPIIFQVTPLRLDLWIILVMVAYKKGTNHWLLGLSLGLLVLFHRNLGLIYLASYFELLLVLFVVGLADLAREKQLNGSSFMALIATHLKQNLANLIIIISSIGLCFVLFHELFSASATIYRKLGVGMIPVSSISFYWHFPILFSCLGVFLFSYRNKLGSKYVGTGFFIVLLAIGNSMYFFGRSHENNILNIAGILVLTVFVLFDILISLTPAKIAEIKEEITAPKNKKDSSVKKVANQEPSKSLEINWHKVYISLPFVLILFMGYYYSDRIAGKLQTQTENLGKGQLTYPLPQMPVDTAAVKQIVHGSEKVYFMDFSWDFYNYYYGHYAPQGYFSPCGAWVYKKDFADFLKDLLSKGYYIVYNVGDIGFFNDYFPLLGYNQTEKVRNMVALSRQPVKFFLPERQETLVHIGIKDSLASVGVENAPITLKDEFTIELIVKPTGTQQANAVILNNQSKFDGVKGFTLQHNGNANQYGFGYSNGSAYMPSVFFTLTDNVWHNLAIVVTRESIKVYDNGNLIITGNAGGLPIANSELPLVIGNKASRDCQFRGFIKEVIISNMALVEQEIKTSPVFDDYPVIAGSPSRRYEAEPDKSQK